MFADAQALLKAESNGKTDFTNEEIHARLQKHLGDRDLPNEISIVGDWLIQQNVSMMAVQVYPGSDYYMENLRNLNEALAFSDKWNIPVMAVTGVGAQMARSGDFFRNAIAPLVTMGVHVIKTYFTEDAKYTIAAAEVPVVMAGGSTTTELATLESVEKWIGMGGSGVDMGRNIIEAKNPKAMMVAVRSIVHEGRTADFAHSTYKAECS
jgi:putative autoinducer-2 (AI-2) aldolase